MRISDWSSDVCSSDLMLKAWGGNASGSGIANIDNTGEVHPDTYWWQHSVGNVRQTPFHTLWLERPDALLQKLREHPRTVGGRCGQCRWLPICNGNTRPRAWADGDLWGQAPARKRTRLNSRH